MSSSAGFLDFFILEANDYVEELDGVLGRGGVMGPRPDVEAIQRLARALRGSATMAKLTPFADLAAGIERIGRALHARTLNWDPALAGALIAAVDDLKILLRSARTWSAADAQRATDRTAELSRLAPVSATRSSPTGVEARPSATPFLATEAANVAAGLELLTTRPADSTTAANVLGRIRALRGVAGVREIGAFAEVLESTEEAARPLELTGEALPPEANALLHAAADLLRALSATLKSGGDANAPSPELESFVQAQDRWAERNDERDRVVPIADLFYADDSSGIVEPAAHPPTTMSERFRLELVSQGEHLRAVLDAARGTPVGIQTSQTRRRLRRSLRSLQATSESFGESMIASALGELADVVDRGEERTVAVLDRVASVLIQPAAEGGTLAVQLRDALTATAPQASARPAPEPTPTKVPEHTPVIAPPPVPTPVAAPERREEPSPAPASPAQDNFLAALDSSIAALHALASRPISAPVPTVDEALVPIESLLYRGRAALERAVEIKDQLRRGGATSDPDALEELFDLVELARAE
jgi:chemotaxis protein histidine kinase CheA